MRMNRGNGLAHCCLVNMPYAPVPGPSLGLGLLQAILRQSGISTTTVYANILWCERIGIRPYDLGHDLTYLFGDWVFAHVVFPGFHPDCSEYLARVFQPGALRSLGINSKDIPEFTATLREKAARFIDELAYEIIDHEPLFVGCSSTFVGHVSSLALLKRISDLAPHIVTVMGGANCESAMGLTTHEQFQWVDYVVSGEADTIIVDLARGIEKYGRDMGRADVPDGVLAPVHRTMKYVGMRNNPPRAVTRSLNDLPVPSYEEFFNALETAPTLSKVVRPGLPIEGSRGCWWGERTQCAFCGMSDESRRYRTKSTQQIFREMEELDERHGLGSFGFVDMIVNPRFFRDFFPVLEKHTRSWGLGFETTPSISAEQIRIMANAGVTCLQPGIESLDPDVLTLLNKASKAWQNVRFLKWCRYYGIHVSWCLLAEIPGEDQDWYERTATILPSLHHLQPPLAINSILLSRFSAYHHDANRYNLRLTPAQPYSSIYPLSEDDIMNLCYFFKEERHSNQEEERITRIHQGKEDLSNAVVQWIQLFDFEARPVVETHDTGAEIRVLDTRSVASERSLTLSGLERAVYLACEDGAQPERICNEFRQKGVAVSETEHIINTLVSKHLLLLLDDHLLALGLPKPLAEIPRYPQYPYGSIDRVFYEALLAARRISAPR
jgi:ribosomal peptide maturation radical SAM protein 1